jgi:hypothetical protein
MVLILLEKEAIALSAMPRMVLAQGLSTILYIIKEL